MKKLTAVLLVLVLLLAGCGAPAQTTEGTTAGTVPDLFTQPATEPPLTTAPKSTVPIKPNGNAGNYFGIANDVQKDELGSYLVYEGGEMHLLLRMRIAELNDKNIGIHLYVDGQPQPYYTSENETAQYMHTFPSMNGEEFTLDLVFTPVTGQAGDILEIGFAVVAYPEYFIDDAWAGITMADWCAMGLTVRTKYLADPPVVELPEVSDRVIQLSREYIDLTAAEAEMFNSGEYQKEVEYEIYVNNRKSYGNLFSVTDDDQLEMEFELKGSTVADFGLVLYLDNQPVSVSAEDVIFVRTRNGKKMTVKAQIDLSGFDGEGVFYAVIVPRNYRSDQLGGSCLLTILGPYYLSGAESMEALQGSD